VIGIAGWKNSGKTTLTVRLVEEFTRRGLKVATIKHAHHAFQVDEGEADSARHRRAGARQVAVVSRSRWAVINELEGAPEPSLLEVIGWLGPCDLVIVEGYKREPIPKIEVRRRAGFPGRPLAAGDPRVVAIAADHEIEGSAVPVFSLDDIGGIADFIERALGPLGGGQSGPAGTQASVGAAVPAGQPE
jgi:molybdopterin-guanine dinucleotide biosynthesis protein B